MNKEKQKMRRLGRTKAKIRGTPARLRLVVSRSLSHVSAQVIDDTVGRTLVSARDLDVPAKERTEKKKTEVAFLVGKLIAERAQTKGIKKVVFDRRDKKYHGRVRAVAEGARSGGLQF